MPTSRLQHPGYIVLNTETYRLARKKGGGPYWRRTRIRVQPGQGEQPVTWDTFHHGMGYSRYGGATEAPVPGTYEYSTTSGTLNGAVNCCFPWIACPGPKVNTITLAAGYGFTRLIEFANRIHAVGDADSDADLYYALINSNYSLYGGNEIGAGQADGPAGQLAVWENHLYIGATSGLAYQSATRGAGCNALHFCRVGRDLWAIPNNATAKVSKLAAGGATWTWGTNDTAVGTSPWGALYNVGDTGRSIKTMIEWGRWLYSGKPEGLFTGDEDGNQWNQLPRVDKAPSANNFLKLGQYDGPLIGPSTMGLFRHAGGASHTVGIEEYKKNASPVRGGYATAQAVGGRWLYIAQKCGSTTYLLAGTHRDPDDPAGPEMVWHTILKTTSTIHDMIVSFLPTAPTLFFVTNDANCYYIKLADDGSPDPNSSNYEADTAGTMSLYLPAVDLGNPGTLKRGHMVELHLGGTMDASRTVTVYASWDGGSYNAVGSAVATTGFNRVFWTAGTNDSGRRCQLRLDIANNSTSAFPKIENVTLYLVELPRTEPGFEGVVCLYDMADKKRPAEKQQTDLEALVEAGVYNLSDPDDPNAANIKVILHEMEEYDIKQEGECSKHSHARLVFREVVYS